MCMLPVERVPKFMCFSVTRCFRVAGHFEKSAWKYPQMTLNTTRSSVSRKCSTAIIVPQISAFCSLIQNICNFSCPPRPTMLNFNFLKFQF